MIVDASVAFKWLVREDDSDAAIGWIERGARLTAPMLIIAETGHALTKKIRLGQIAADGAVDLFQRLPSLLTLVDDEPFARRAFQLSLELRHSYYDCVYLAMAESTNAGLLTADRRFHAKLGHYGAQVELLGAMRP